MNFHESLTALLILGAPWLVMMAAMSLAWWLTLWTKCGGVRYNAVFRLLAVALVCPLLLAAFYVADRLRIPVPGDIVVFCALAPLAFFGLPLSLAIVLFAGVVAAYVFISDWLSRTHKDTP